MLIVGAHKEKIICKGHTLAKLILSAVPRRDNDLALDPLFFHL